MAQFVLSENNFKKLEKDWGDEIERDAKYWRENDAKLRAINSVGSYEEFSDIVKAAHLQPLQRKELLEMHKQNKVWNNFNNLNGNKTDQMMHIKQSEEPLKYQDKVLDLSLPQTPAELAHNWRKLNSQGRMSLLKQLPLSSLRLLLQVEAPPGMLGDLAAILKPGIDKAELAWQVQLMEALINSARFSLNLQFLSTKDKESYQLIFDKIKSEKEFKNSMSCICKEFQLQ